MNRSVLIALITGVLLISHMLSCTPSPTRDITGKYLKVTCDEEADPPNAYLLIEKHQWYEGSYKLTVVDTTDVKIHDPILYGFDGKDMVFHGQRMGKFTNDFSTIRHEASGCTYKK